MFCVPETGAPGDETLIAYPKTWDPLVRTDLADLVGASAAGRMHRRCLGAALWLVTGCSPSGADDGLFGTENASDENPSAATGDAPDESTSAGAGDSHADENTAADASDSHADENTRDR